MSVSRSARSSADRGSRGSNGATTRRPAASSEQDLRGNSALAAERGAAGGQAGTVVVGEGDTVSGLAEKGTGDVMKYRELNTFNGRDAEDASIEPGDILYVPEGWDVAAMGGVPAAAPEAAAPAVEEPTEAYGDGLDMYKLLEVGKAAAQTGVDAAYGAANSAYDMAYGAVDAASEWLWGADENEQGTPEVGPEVVEEELSPGTGAEQGLSAAQREQFVRYKSEEDGGGVDQTVEGLTPLEIARKAIEKGDAGSHYAIDKDALAKVQSGDASADTFWCSGFLIWTLAAYGMNVNAAVLGPNGREYSYKNPAGKEYPVTVKRLMDGEVEAVSAMDYVAEQGLDGGLIGQAGVDFTVGYGEDKFEGDVEDHSTAVKGAAGALVLAGLGTEVPETDQRPGDMNQARWKGNFRYYDSASGTWKTDYDKPIDYYGQGHAWVSGAVVVRGSAWVGLPNSPLVDGQAAAEVAWVEGAELTLTDATDPNLVGDVETVLTAERLEANTHKGIERANRAGGENDGGLQATGQREVPAQSSHDGFFVYTGRVTGTPWAAHTPASPDVAPPGVEIPGLEAAPEPAEEEESWTDWARGKIGF